MLALVVTAVAVASLAELLFSNTSAHWYVCAGTIESPHDTFVHA